MVLINESLTIIFIVFVVFVVFFLFFSFFLFFLFFLSFFFKETYYQINPKEWTKINNSDNNDWMVDPIPCSDTDKDFILNITYKEIELLKDEAQDICFDKVIEFCLPRFTDAEAGQQLLWEY